MAKKTRYYVVWKGITPGIYTQWEDCQRQVKGFTGAAYKAFDRREEAEAAFGDTPAHYIKRRSSATPEKKPATASDKSGQEGDRQGEEHIVHGPEGAKAPAACLMPPKLPAGVNAEALAVDAACSGNPGAMEYRGVYLRTGDEVFHFGPIYGTNNVGEFLAIVHGLAELKRRGLKMPIYSDSRNALLWVKKKRCGTKLKRTPRTEKLFDLIERAELWLQNNPYDTPLIKWETDRWGEVPADFGRK